MQHCIWRQPKAQCDVVGKTGSHEMSLRDDLIMVLLVLIHLIGSCQWSACFLFCFVLLLSFLFLLLIFYSKMCSSLIDKLQTKKQTKCSIDWHYISKRYDEIKYWFIKPKYKQAILNVENFKTKNEEKKLNPREKSVMNVMRKNMARFVCCSCKSKWNRCKMHAISVRLVHI